MAVAGLVVDAYVRVSLVGIETGGGGLPELLETGRARAYQAVTTGAIEGVKEGLGMTKSDRTG